MKLTKEACTALGICTEGFRDALKLGIVGLEPREIIKAFRAAGQEINAQEVEALLKTPAYIKLSGDFKVSSYLVFNHQTGQHERYPNEVLARKRRDDLLVARMEELKRANPIMREIFNKDGDSALEPIE